MSKTENCSEAKIGAATFCNQLNIGQTNDNAWYYLVFKPLDAPYAKDKDWFKYKGIDKCRQKLGSHTRSLLTREIMDCAKVHINAMVYGPIKIYDLNNKIAFNKYKILCVVINDTLDDRKRVLKYMLKETKKRSFKLYKDYLLKESKET